jgi:hypothetical protein
MPGVRKNYQLFGRWDIVKNFLDFRLSSPLILQSMKHQHWTINPFRIGHGIMGKPIEPLETPTD